MLKIWRCEIGAVYDSELSIGADQPLRAAVSKAYRELTGRNCDFNFSGWQPYGTLTEVQQQLIEEDTKGALRGKG